jgi:hypothetical protein
MFAYSNNGMNSQEVADDHTALAGEVLFPNQAAPAELTAAFPGFPAAVQAEIDRLEYSQGRAARAALLALLPPGTGNPRDRLQVLEDQIAALRAQLVH